MAQMQGERDIAQKVNWWDRFLKGAIAGVSASIGAAGDVEQREGTAAEPGATSIGSRSQSASLCP